LEHGDDLAVGKAGLLHGTSSRKDTRKFHFWRLLMGGGITSRACLPLRRALSPGSLQAAGGIGAWVIMRQ
ncbi:hypothetical protein, partial [Xanthomonas phaseoli]